MFCLNCYKLDSYFNHQYYYCPRKQLLVLEEYVDSCTSMFELPSIDTDIIMVNKLRPDLEKLFYKHFPKDDASKFVFGYNTDTTETNYYI